VSDWIADANILLRADAPDHADYPIVSAALLRLRERGDRILLTPQSLCETWGVFTRPLERNSFGLSNEETQRRVRDILRLYPFIADPPTLFGEWFALVTLFGVRGVQVHDARLVAACLAHRVTQILTLNVDDFRRYAGFVTAVHPANV